MNERIQELAKQADPDHWHSRWYSGINPRVLDPEIKKFAELLIRECMEQIGDAIPDTNCSAADAYKTAKLAATSRVKEHFGVSE